MLSLPSTLCRHIGLLFGERLDTLFTSSDKRNIQIHPSTRYRIRCGFIFFRFGPVHTLSDSLRIYIFHSEERIYFFPDSLSNSPDTCGRSAAVSGKKKLRIRKYPDTTASFTQNGCYGNQPQPPEVVFYSIDANTSCFFTKQDLTVK